jgi:D-mannonate dehydratase
MKIRLVGAELFHEDERTDGQTDMAKLIVAFHNFAKATNQSFNTVG